MASSTTDNWIAESAIFIKAPIAKVWDALTNPEIIKQWFFGVDTITDWKVGSPILHRGVWDGKPFEDKGTVLKFEPRKMVMTTHWSPLSGTPDIPENYQNVTYTVTERDGGTEVIIANDGNENAESRDHSAQQWQMVLESLKKLLEK